MNGTITKVKGLSHIQQLAALALRADSQLAADHVRALIQLSEEAGDMRAVRRLKKVLLDSEFGNDQPSKIDSADVDRLIPSRHSRISSRS